MKVQITIEEIIHHTLDVEVSSMENAYNEIRDMYSKGELVLDDSTLIDASVMIGEDDGENDWFTFM